MTFAEMKPLVDALPEEEKQKLKAYLVEDDSLDAGKDKPRVIGLHKGLIHAHKDFDEEISEAFLIGEEE